MEVEATTRRATGPSPHVDAAWACRGRRANSRARELASAQDGGWVVITAPRVAHSPRARFFSAICQKCRHARLHPLITKRRASPRRVQRSARGLGVPRPSSATHPHAGRTSTPASPQPSCRRVTRQGDKPALPALPITAISHTAAALPIDQSDVWNPLAHRNTAAVPFGSVPAVSAVLPPSHKRGSVSKSAIELKSFRSVDTQIS